VKMMDKYCIVTVKSENMDAVLKWWIKKCVVWLMKE
jgi:hypothetical protein